MDIRLNRRGFGRYKTEIVFHQTARPKIHWSVVSSLVSSLVSERGTRIALGVMDE